MTYHLFSARRTKARKNHQCVWCSHPIAIGSVYVRERSIYDGAHQNLAWHEACRKADRDMPRDGYEYELYGDDEMPFFALYQLEMLVLEHMEDMK